MKHRGKSQNYTRRNENLFPVNIDRLEQGCVTPQEQVVNNIVTALLQLKNAVTTFNSFVCGNTT